MYKYLLSDFILQTTGKQFFQTDLAKMVAYPLTPSAECWLGGGALRRTVIGQSLDSDFDYFFPSVDAFMRRKDLLESVGSTKVRETINQITYQFLGCKVQLIKRLWESADRVIDDFDFTNCQLITDGSHIWVGGYTMWDLAHMRLRIHKIQNVQASLRRLIKYTKQGFYACDGTLLGILQAAKESDLQEAFYID